MTKSAPLLAFASVLLVVAIGLVAYGATQIPSPRFTGELKELLPKPPPGWTLKEKAIADTPEMQQAVGELLNFSDGIFADYTDTAGNRISVYIAYWTPGKMSHRLVAGHTPDVCWVNGGWAKTDSIRLEALTLPPISGLRRNNSITPPGEARTFTTNGTPEHVWFWHLVGDESKSYNTGANPPWHAVITDLLSKGLNQREEQFFIRISSNKPLDQFINGPVLPALLSAIPWPEQS